MSELPEVECIGCRRRARCVRVSDGTIYRPMAWVYPNNGTPLLGHCRDCQARIEAAATLERVNNCKTVAEYADVLRSIGLHEAADGAAERLAHLNAGDDRGHTEDG